MSDTTPGSEPTPDPTPGTTPDPAPLASQPDPHPAPASQPAPQPPSQGGWSSANASQQANDAVATLKKGNPLDLATVGAGLLVFLASLLPYYTMSYDMGAFGGETSGSANAWHGFFGWFAVLCVVAAAGILVAHLLGVAMSFPVRLVVLALFGVALLCTIVAMFVYPGESCEDVLGAFGGEAVCKGFDEGRGFGYWLALLATIAGTALAALRRSAP